MAVSINKQNQGLRNLQSLVDEIPQAAKDDKSTPIVLVSGFSGWGEALFGTFNYWGGFESLPTVLQKLGHTVIVVRIGPLSSNWERACEVYAQLTEGKFDEPEDYPCTEIDIDYGDYFPQIHGYHRSSRTKMAAIFGTLKTGWRWGADNPAHFICHSQGGNTMRMLVELLSGRCENLHRQYFPASLGNRQKWVKSIATLGTPHKGTTVTNVVQGLLPRDPQETITIITRLVVSVSFRKPRFFDLQLDHWDFYRKTIDPSLKPNESFIDMETRLRPYVEAWWLGTHNGFYDNSVEGVRALNEFAAAPKSPTSFYFTMSFDATEKFPKIPLSAKDFAGFPFRFPLKYIPNPFNVLGRFGAGALNALSYFPGAPTTAGLAKWAVGVANDKLGSLGFFSQIPTTGDLVPRSDVLPAMAVTALAMGGFTHPNNEVPTGLSPDITSAQFQPNDGIVNTVSMRGPDDEYISDGRDFPIRNLLAEEARGTYWHLGINKTMDHADQIGVFTVGETYQEVQLLYRWLGELLASLPSVPA